MENKTNQLEGASSRRAFLGRSLAVGAGIASAGLLTDTLPALAAHSRNITKGDVAILRFLAAAEIIEADLWQQYNELGGIPDPEVPGGKPIPAYVTAIQALDMDMPQYIHDNTDDEISHFTFLNRFLASIGADPVDLRHFAHLPSSRATGAQQIGRLTNLMQLTVDTSWWTRYRSSTGNPDLGNAFPQAVPGLSQGRFPAIPRSDDDLDGSTASTPSNHLQAIANTAGFHFGFIEQGGTSLYPSLAQRVTNVEVLRVLLSIGPTEAMHFQTWHDKAGNARAITDPTNGLTFPNLADSTDQNLEGNLIMPEPTAFLSHSFPAVSIVRPTNTTGAAQGAVKSLTDDGLFIGQPPDFFALLNNLARAADAAQRGF